MFAAGCTVNSKSVTNCVVDAAVALATDYFTREDEDARQFVQLVTGIDEQSAVLTCMSATISTISDNLSPKTVDIYSDSPHQPFSKTYTENFVINTQTFDTRQLGNCPGRQYLNPTTFNNQLDAVFPHSLAVGGKTFDSLPSDGSDESVIARALYNNFSVDFTAPLSTTYDVAVPSGMEVASLTVPFTFSYNIGTADIAQGDVTSKPIEWAFPTSVTSGSPTGLSLVPCGSAPSQVALAPYQTNMPGCDTSSAYAQWFDSAQQYSCDSSKGLVVDVQESDPTQPTFFDAFKGLLPADFDMSVTASHLQATSTTIAEPKVCAGMRLDDSDLTDLELFVCSDGSWLGRYDTFSSPSEPNKMHIDGTGRVASSTMYNLSVQVRGNRLTLAINQQPIEIYTYRSNFDGFYASSLVVDTNPESTAASPSRGDVTFSSFQFAPL
jgi:hypothetical protein